MKTKATRSKCIWATAIAAVAVCMTMTMSGVAAPPASNLGSAYVSSVTSDGSCVRSTTNGGGIQFWDIQAGGTYTVTLSGATDCYQGMNSQIGVIVHNSGGGNIYVLANWQSDGVYTFTITLTTQCLTMPIEYCTHNANDLPANQPGTGLFAQDAPGGAPGGHIGHLRTATFDASCNVTGEDTTCQGPPPTASITACKYYDKNANGTQDAGEPALDGWPFCIDPLDNAIPALHTQLTANGGCLSWSNLTTPGEYTVTEANANESNWFHSTSATSLIVFPPSGGSETRKFGNYCTSPSGGLTLGFWSNKNGNKLLTGNANGTGTTLLPAVVNLLNAPSSCNNYSGPVLVNANGTRHTFTNSYSAFRSWLLSATATNMAYMLSAQLSALKLDVYFNFVDGNAFDLCSSMTVNGLISAASDQLCMDPNTVSGNPTRLAQETLKNCIDVINNNGPVVPVTPCPYTFPNPPAPCP
jgi:hypothetical protein